ncbi:hypothetical protein OG444_38715 [Streptomyces sp. NBC_01232]|uniref:hypothetical protein n=1 Tax=Streptomyces sp. NBC_01232 TaxID=2903786 RepID=UPI002E13CF42|nr:hypothetical protein OG444_38715 [Streptomyces sp. NBC_01232]
MTKFLLSVHVLAAIITIGPVTVAASMFPAVARRALADADADADADAGVDGAAAVLPAARTLHRICRVYAVIAVVVPVFGLATANSLHVLTSPWLLTSIALTAAAAAVLGGLVLPRQAAALAGLRTAVDEQRAAPAVLRALARLGTYTGLFNLLWATVTVLMIVRPGSTTGA